MCAIVIWHHDVGSHATVADRLPAGRIELGGRQPDPGLVSAQREDPLHASFAIAALADDRASAMIAYGPSKYLAGTGRITIDQHDQAELATSRRSCAW